MKVSKRLIVTIVAGIMFMIILYTTDYKPVEIATAVTMILAVYISGETFKPSK